MASAGQMRAATSPPALATTYEGGHPDLLEQLTPLVDYIEISPDSIAHRTGERYQLHPAIVEEFTRSGVKKRFLVHGVGLSIASAEGFSERYIRLLDDVFSIFDVAWHSEHLGYTTVEGEPLGTMLPPPRTREMLDILCERVRFLRERYGVPFLLENVIRLLPDYAPEFSEAEFMNQLAQNTGCGFLLDAYNLECDAYNLGFEIEPFLGELDLARVREMHIAGGVRHEGFQLDVHSRCVADSTLRLAAKILRRAPGIQAVTFEYLKEAIPHLGAGAICGELARIRKELCA